MHTIHRNTFTTYFTEREEKQLLKTLKDCSTVYARRDHAWMRVLRHSGMRIEALAGANVYDAKQALLEGKYYIRPEILKGHKDGGKGHYVTVNKSLRQALKDLLGIRRAMKLPDFDDRPLVVSRKGGRMGVRAYQHAMTSWCRKAGIDVEGSPHWWRHTLAKRLMKNSTAPDPRAVVMSVLGHKDLNSTIIYTLPDKEDIELAMQEVS